MNTSLPVTVRRLENPSDSEIQRAVYVAQDAFREDSFFKVLVRGETFLLPYVFESFIRDALIGGEVHVATHGPKIDDIVGIAVWYGPDQSFGATESQRAAQEEFFFSRCTEDLQGWWMETLMQTMERLATEALGPEFHEAQWHLILFGVLPDHQRKGVAKSMIKVAEERAKADGVSIVLETETDIDLVIYEKMGFVVKGQITLVSPWAPECPVYQLLRVLDK